MKVLVTTPHPEKAGGVADFFTTLRPYLPGGVRYFTAGSRKGERALAALPRLARDCAGFLSAMKKHDIVHLNPSVGPKALLREGFMLAAAKMAGKKTVVLFHGWSPAFGRRIRSRRFWLFRRCFFSSDALIVLAGDFADALREAGYTGGIFTESTFVPDDIFSSGLKKHVSADRARILFLARVEREKGVFEALRAAGALRGKGLRVSLTVAGEGGALPAAKKFARGRSMDYVSFPGHIRGAEKAEAFRKADIYLLPTFHDEGMPISVLEAMAFGVPVVTRPAGGLGGFFEDGKMGFMTESSSPLEFARLCEALVKNPALRQRMGEYNRGYARGRFRASSFARRLLGVYGGLAGQEPSA